MRLRSMFLLFILAVIGLFTALNWGVFLTNTTLSMGVTTLQAPLGLIMLGLLVAVVVFFLVYVLYLQSTVMFDARRHAKELQANRELADKAEASRFTELRAFLDAGLKQRAQQEASTQQALMARLDALEDRLTSGRGQHEGPR